jgi:hypothetical protein
VKDAVGYVVAVLCSFVTGAAAIPVLVSLRLTLNLLWGALGGSHWTLRSLDRFALVIMVLVCPALFAFSLVLYILSVVQGKKRPSQEQQWKQRLQEYGLYLLLRRFLFVIGALALLFALSWLAQQVAWRVLAS